MNCLNMSELFKKQALNMSPDFNICESIDIVHGMWMHWIKLQQNQLTTVLHCWVPARIKGQTEKSTTTRLVTCLCMKAYLAANFSYIADNFGSQSMGSSGEDTVHSKCDINILYIYILCIMCVCISGGIVYCMISANAASNMEVNWRCFPRMVPRWLCELLHGRRTDLQACPGMWIMAANCIHKVYCRIDLTVSLEFTIYVHYMVLCALILPYSHTIHTDTVNIHHKVILNACCTHINHITCTQKNKSITLRLPLFNCTQDSEWLFKPCLHQTLDQELHEWCQAMFLATGKNAVWCVIDFDIPLLKGRTESEDTSCSLVCAGGLFEFVCLQIRFGRVFFFPLHFLFKDSDSKQVADILQLLDID